MLIIPTLNKLSNFDSFRRATLSEFKTVFTLKSFTQNVPPNVTPS